MYRSAVRNNRPVLRLCTWWRTETLRGFRELHNYRVFLFKCYLRTVSVAQILSLVIGEWMELTIMEWYSQGKTVVLGEKFVSVRKSNVAWPEVDPGPWWGFDDYQPELIKMTWVNTFQRSWNAATGIPWSLKLEVGFFETSEINNLLLSVTTQKTWIIIVETVDTSDLFTEFQFFANQFLQPIPTLIFRAKSSTMEVTAFYVRVTVHRNKFLYNKTN
jgi:hypothetical protein